MLLTNSRSCSSNTVRVGPNSKLQSSDCHVTKPATGRYFFDASITGYVTYLRKYAKGRPNWDNDHSGSIDRSRLLKAKELDGQLINVNDVAEAWSAVTVTMRNRLLAIPARAAPLLVGKNASEVVQEQLEALIHEALTELSSTRVEGVDTARR